MQLKNCTSTRRASAITSPANTLTTALVAALAASTIASTLSADFTTRRWTSDTSYELAISHMPDLDQRRDGLAADSDGDAGGMYCAPTSAANLFAYIANHGYASVAPGAADWEDAANYEAGTDFIDLLGDRMFTSGTGGTFGPFAYTGVVTTLTLEAGTRFVAEMESWTPWNAVSLKEMLRAGIDEQAISMLAYGKYENLGTNSCGETVIWRDGGHFMTLVGGKRSGSTRQISASDPDDSSNTTNQSAFTINTWSCPWVNDLCVFPTVTGSCTFGTNQSMSRIMRGSSDDFRIIDFRISIRPSHCYSWGAFSDGSTALRILTATINGAEQRLVPVAPSIAQSARLAVSPSGIPFALANPGRAAQILVLAAGPNGPALMPANLGGLQFPRIDEIVFASDRTLVVRSGRMLHAIGGLDAGNPTEDDNAPTLAWSREVPFDVALMVAGRGAEAGDGVHAVHAFSTDLRAIATIGDDPEGGPVIRSVPAALPLDPQRLANTVVVEDSKHTLWFAQPGNSFVSALLPEGNFFNLQLPIQSLQALSIDDLDRLLVVEAGKVRAFAHGPQGVVEVDAAQVPFAGMQGGRGLVVERSTGNADSRFHGHNGWREIKEPTAAIVGDLNGDAKVDATDMATVLSAWGSAQPGNPADIDRDGFVGPQDLAALLANWGA